jgi:hypothetical protein
LGFLVYCLLFLRQRLSCDLGWLQILYLPASYILVLGL